MDFSVLRGNFFKFEINLIFAENNLCITPYIAAP